MDRQHQLDQLLDDWEDQRMVNPALTLIDFVDQWGDGIDDEVLSSFKAKVAKLAQFDERVFDAIGATQSPSLPQFRNRKVGPSVGDHPIDGYVLVSRLGKGGFGEVWRATGPGGFDVALKFVGVGNRFGDSELRALETMKGVRHPHLLAVFGAWQTSDTLIIATELADRTLLDRFNEARKQGHTGIPIDELLGYMQEAAEGIDALNDPGSSGRLRIQHRDIKPQNLLLSGGSVKVGDFGLARHLEHNITGHTGSLTMAYAAPECFDGNISQHSDQYSLAVTFCQLVGGQLPFDGSYAEVMNGHRSKPPDLSSVPRQYRDAVLRALAKKPKDRWNSSTEFVQALAGSDFQQVVEADSSIFATFQRRLAEIPRSFVWGSAAAAVIVLVCLSLLFYSEDRWKVDDQSQIGPNGSSNAESIDIDASTKLITLAVTDFDNHSQNPSLDGFRLGFRDMLVTDLSRISAIKVLERGRLKDLLEEHDLTKTPFIDPQAAVRLGKGLSANHILTGSYVIAGDDIRVDVRLVSVETGEVVLADAITGKKSDVFPLQQALSSKVLSGLDIKPSEEEQAALNVPQTNDFNSFRLYSDARLAQLQGHREEAKKRFEEALQFDSKFSLAAHELNRLESDALFRLSDSQQQRANESGEIGRRLQEHWKEHQEVIEQDRGDAEYFASIIVLAAHAGLFGDFDQERQLLVTFWERFSESVPPGQSLSIAKQIRQSIVKESKFFQQTVDSGYYDILMSSSTEKYLKYELRGHYHWPRWSVIWPFDEDARTAFGAEIASKLESSKSSWRSMFEENIPADPHDYLKAIFDFTDLLTDQSANPTRFSETMRIHLSIARYYGQLPNCPPPLDAEFRRIQATLLRRLASLNDVSQMEPEIIQDALPVLRAIAKTETDTEKRDKADKLFLRFVRQFRVNQGLPASADEEPFRFYGKPLEGLPILVVWDYTDMEDGRIDIHVRESFSDAIRAMPENTRFNFLWAGNFNEKDGSLFEEPRAADNAAKRKALDWLNQERPSPVKERLAKVVETIASDWDEQGLVVIVALNKEVSIPQSTIDFLLRKRAPPRFLVVAAHKQKQLAQLAAASNGAAVLLKSKGGSFGDDEYDIVAEPWDVSNEKPEPSTSAIDPVQPTDVTIDDFGLDARIVNHEIRKHLQAAIEKYLSSLDSRKVSNTRYFVSLTMLAQIAGRIGHHPLEDALTKKWLTEIEPMADPIAALAYERNREQSADRPSVAKPLLLELMEDLRTESRALWDEPRIDGLSDLPEPKLAPNSESHIWASPIFWLRGMSEYREEMAADIIDSLLKYHIGAGSEFNTEFIGPASINWMHHLVQFQGGKRPGTALKYAEMALQICDSIPITDQESQEWLLEGMERIRKNKQKILDETETPMDWVAASEYSPRRPWRGIERSPPSLPLFGSTLKGDSLVVVCDVSASQGSDRSKALRGLLLAVAEAGDGIKLRFILSGKQIEMWPNEPGDEKMALLNSDTRTSLSNWIKKQDQSGLATPSHTTGNLAKAIAAASLITDQNGEPPTAIAVVCQDADLEKFDVADLVGKIPIHTFSIPRLGNSTSSMQKMQIDKMRTLARKSGGQFKVISDDWIWLYLETRKQN